MVKARDQYSVVAVAELLAKQWDESEVVYSKSGESCWLRGHDARLLQLRHHAWMPGHRESGCVRQLIVDTSISMKKNKVRLSKALELFSQRVKYVRHGESVTSLCSRARHR